jgi:hypothetical protein
MVRKAVPEGWAVTVQTARRGEVEASVSATDPARSAPTLAGFLQGARLVAKAEDGAATLEGVLLLFDGEPEAEAFVALRRAHDEEMQKRLADSPTAVLEAEYADHTGRSGMQGYAVRRRQAHPDGERRVRTQVTWQGPFVIEVTAVGDAIGDPAQDDAIEDAADEILAITSPRKPR